MRYPTEKELEQLATWPIRALADCQVVLTAAAELWWPPRPHDSLGQFPRAHFATGGWSGNEDVLTALKANAVFWALCWESSSVGGLHVFRLPDYPTSSDGAGGAID